MSSASRKFAIRTGVSVIAPSSAARCEIDLSGGATTVPRSRSTGSKLDARHPRATGNPSPAISSSARAACSAPLTHSETRPCLKSADGLNAMSTMLTPARPSASAMSAITPGRFGTEARSSQTVAALQPGLQQRPPVRRRRLVPRRHRVGVAAPAAPSATSESRRTVSSIRSTSASRLAR